MALLKELIETKKEAGRELAELERRREELNRTILEAEMEMPNIEVSSRLEYVPDAEELHYTSLRGEVTPVPITADQIADLYVAIFGEPEGDDEEPDEGLLITNAMGVPTTLQEVIDDLRKAPTRLSLENYYYRLMNGDRKVVASGEDLSKVEEFAMKLLSREPQTLKIELMTRANKKARTAYSRKFTGGPIG